MNPVDDDGKDGQAGGERPPPIRGAAVRFLEAAAARGNRTAQGMLDREAAGDRQEVSDGDAGDEHQSDGQRAAGSETDAVAPDVAAEPMADAPSAGVETAAALPPMSFPVPRTRAKGVRHPQVPTKAQVERHVLEQQVTYAPWCAHCVRASALMRQHPAVVGESPDVPTVSADFCFMKSREADAGDGIPVLVMRESQTRSIFSHACAGKSTTREGYSGYIIEKAIEDIDSDQKDVHLKTDREPAMLAFQARVQQGRKCRTTPTNSPKGIH